MLSLSHCRYEGSHGMAIGSQCRKSGCNTVYLGWQQRDMEYEGGGIANNLLEFVNFQFKM